MIPTEGRFSSIDFIHVAIIVERQFYPSKQRFLDLARHESEHPLPGHVFSPSANCVFEGKRHSKAQRYPRILR